MVRVSVIIATRNRCGLLRRSIRSATLAGSGVEVVVVDDASTDETWQICKAFSDLVYVRLNRRHGLAGARNVGILASSGEYITFLDDDDLRLRQLLDHQVDELSRHAEIGMIYGQALLGDADCLSTGRAYPKTCPEGDIFWPLLESNFVPCPTVVFRRRCLDRVGLMNEELMRATDWDLWLRIAEVYPVLALRSPIAIYRQASSRSDQLTSDAATFVRSVREVHRERWMKLPRAANASKRVRDKASRNFSVNMAKHLLGETKRALVSGNAFAAAKTLTTAITGYPLTCARLAASELSSRYSEV